MVAYISTQRRAPVAFGPMPERTANGGIPHSDSLRDVLAVAPPSTLVPKRDALQTRSSGAVLVHESAHHHHNAIQEHENETAEVVLVCEPEGTSLMMGGLHPRFALLVSAMFSCLQLLAFAGLQCCVTALQSVWLFVKLCLLQHPLSATVQCVQACVDV